MKPVNCPACRKKMDDGLLFLGLENTGRYVAPVGTWVEGEIKLGFFGYNTKKKKRKPVRAFCCSECGLIQLQAFTAKG